MTGILPAVVKPELEGGNLILVVVVALIALGALGMAAMFRSQVLAAGEGTDNMKTIALAVQEGANAYLTRQFRTLAIFAAIAFFALLVLPADDTTVRIFRSVFFIVGAGFSAAVGYLGMNLAVRANLRVAAAAETTGREPAMTIGLRTGAMVGMLTVGLGLLGASLVVLFFQDEAPDVLEGFGFGAALLAMFMRVGGGIFTKAADVGADLVGKVEQGIPEDDPRNAATIADNVGDNVGDCAGMAADLFESYAVTLVAALILGSQAFGDKGLVFPLLIPAIGALTAVAGVYLTKPKAGENGLTTINKSFYISSGIAAVASVVLSYLYLPSSFAEFTNIAVDLAGAEGDPRFIAASAVVIGIVMSAGILALTGYYTGTEYRPVKDVGKTSLTGPATVILSGLSVGFESAVYTTLVIGAAVFGAYLLGGAALTVSLFAVALAGCGLLTTVGVIVAMDTFGPVSDNAQGIAEMSGDVSPRGRADPHRARRRRQHHQGDHQGHRDRHRGAGRDGAVRLLRHVGVRVARRGQRRPRRGVPAGLQRLQPGGHRRRAARCGRGVPLLRPRHQRGRPRCRRGRHGGPPPVPRDPRHHGGHRSSGVRQGRRHRHQGLAARARDARHPRRARPDRGGLRPRRDRPGRLPRRSDRHRHPDGRLPGQRRWRLGQRQEAGRGRPPRWQGLGRPRGDDHR